MRSSAPLLFGFGQDGQGILPWLAQNVAALFTILLSAVLILLVLALLYAIVHELRRDTIYLDPLEVPDELARRGYRPAVITERLLDALVDLRRHALSYSEQRGLDTSAARLDLQVPGNLSLQALVRYARRLLRMPESHIGGEITQEGAELGLRLRHRDGRGVAILCDERASSEGVLLERGAEAILLQLDPFVLAQHFIDLETQATQPKFERAAATLEALVARPTTPYHGYALNMLGLIDWLKGNRDTATERFRRAIEVAPKLPLAYGNWAGLLTTQGLYAEARKLRERALGCPASTPGSLMDRALCLCLLHRDELAYAEVRRALKRHPDSIPLLTAAGFALVRLRRPHEAIPLLERVRASGHRSVTFYRPLVRAYIAIGDAATALSRTQERLHWGVIDGRRHHTLVPALVAAGRHEEALVAYDAARNSYCDAETMTGRGDALRALGRHDEAIEVYQEALAADPQCAEAHAGWGRALAAQSRHKDAVAKLAEAARVDPNYADAFREWSRSLAALGRSAESGKKLRHAAALDRGSRAPSPVP